MYQQKKKKPKGIDVSAIIGEPTTIGRPGRAVKPRPKVSGGGLPNYGNWVNGVWVGPKPTSATTVGKPTPSATTVGKPTTVPKVRARAPTPVPKKKRYGYM